MRILLLIMMCITLLSLGTVSYAQEQDEQATQSASLENIKKIIKENLSSGAVRGAIDNLLNRKLAILGQVIRVTDETVTITNRLGTRIIPVDEAISITKDGKEIKISDIAVENWITVLGKIKDDTFSPVFIYVYSKSLLPKPQFVEIGTITEITRNTITIAPRSGEGNKTISILAITNFEDVNGVKTSLADLTKDITVLVSGYEVETKIEALTIRSLVAATESGE